MRSILRQSEASLAQLLAGLPAVLIVGPRAVGKTTLAEDHAATILRADVPSVAESLQADPDAVLRNRDEPILIDEWQMAPSILGAVKRAVDSDPRPGRFILTGSVRANLQSDTWPGTGRLVRLNLFGLTQAEVEGLQPKFIEAVFGDVNRLLDIRSQLDIGDYLERLAKSGFPEAFRIQDLQLRSTWLRGYRDELLHRDIEQVHQTRRPRQLHRFVAALSLSTAAIPRLVTLQQAADIDKETAASYLDALEALFVVERMPAWWSNRLSRLAKSAKIHFVDPALAQQMMGLDSQGVMLDPTTRGRLIESFVVAQLRAEIASSRDEVVMHHLRTSDGRREIDIILERPDGKIVAIEVKASSRVDRSDAKHLLWLESELGDRMIAGVILHSGGESFRLDDSIVAAPIESLWR